MQNENRINSNLYKLLLRLFLTSDSLNKFHNLTVVVFTITGSAGLPLADNFIYRLIPAILRQNG